MWTKENINGAVSTYISNLVYDKSLIKMEIPEGIRYFIRHLNANRSENMSDELIQKIDGRAEQYISETAFTFSAEHLTKQFLDNKENIKKAYIQGAWDMYTDKCNF